MRLVLFTLDCVKHCCVLHSTKFRCDTDDHSEQIIAVSTEIISYEKGMSQGVFPVLPADGPEMDPQLFLFMLHSAQGQFCII